MKRYGLVVWNEKSAYTCTLHFENDEDAIKHTKSRLGKYDRARLMDADGRKEIFWK